MIEKLLQMGASVNPEGSNLAYSPLSASIIIGNDALVQELIGLGANIAPLNAQTTPIIAAIQANRLDILEFIFSFGHIPDQQIINALCNNIHNCDSSVFNLALSKVENINLPNQNGQTLLHRILSIPEEKSMVLAEKLIAEHNAKLQVSEFDSLIWLASRANFGGTQLIHFILKTSDSQLKFEGMNFILETMLKTINGVNVELLQILVDHGLTINPNNIKLALDHQNLPHAVWPDYIPKMLEIIFANHRSSTNQRTY